MRRTILGEFPKQSAKLCPSPNKTLNKGKKSSFITLDKNYSTNQKRTLPNVKYNHNSKLQPGLNLKATSSKINEPPKSHELSKAIKLARQMNPDVSYK